MKINLDDVANLLGNPNSAQNTVNENSTRIENAFENTLSRDGTSPNQMLADLDMNNNDVLNVGTIDTDSLILGGKVVVPGDGVVNLPATVMTKPVYDPNLVGGDVFDPSNWGVFDTKASAQSKSIKPQVNAVILHSGAVAGDGRGGLYRRTSSGIDDKFTSADGQVWYRTKDVSSNLRVIQDRLTNAPVLVQKFLMEPFFGFDNMASSPNNINTEIYPGSGYTAQGLWHCKLSTGVEYLFVAERPVPSSYLKEERHRIVQFLFKRDGSVVSHVAFSSELNIGHAGGLSGVVNPDDSVTLYAWSETIDLHEGNDSGKGFSKIEWKGGATTQADVTSYQVFGYNGSSDPRSAYRHVDCAVDYTGQEIVFIGYKLNSGSDNFIDQTVFVFDLPALLAAPNDAARMQMAPKEQWIFQIPSVDRGMYKQGIAIRNGIIAIISGFTNPMVPETITFLDREGNVIRRAQPSNNRAIYGLDNLLNHPTLGTPMQFEPEGVCFVDDTEVIFLMMDQWRQSPDIVTMTSPADPTALNPKRFACISPGTTADPFQVDGWVETNRAATRGAWVAAPAPVYSIGQVITRRSKMIHSLKVPTGESGELPLSAGMNARYARMAPIISYETSPNVTFKAGTAFQIFGYSYPFNEYIPAVEYLYSRTGQSSLRIYDFWNQGYNSAPSFQMGFRWNGGREIGSLAFAAGAGGIFWYGATDSSTPGQMIIRTRGGGGLKLLSGSTGALVPFNSGTDLGGSTGSDRWNKAWLAALDVTGAVATGALTVTGAMTASTTVTANGQITGQTLKTTPVAVTSLPSAATAGAGARAFVNNANATTFNSTVAAGGANLVPVFSDGTNWKIG